MDVVFVHLCKEIPQPRSVFFVIITLAQSEDSYTTIKIEFVLKEGLSLARLDHGLALKCEACGYGFTVRWVLQHQLYVSIYINSNEREIWRAIEACCKCILRP